MYQALRSFTEKQGNLCAGRYLTALWSLDSTHCNYSYHLLN